MLHEYVMLVEVKPVIKILLKSPHYYMIIIIAVLGIGPRV
jgi:hypothetical protein